MMEGLPLDTNNPAVRDYLALIRHVSGCSLRMEQTKLTRQPSTRVGYSGTQVAGLDSPQSAGEHHHGAGLHHCRYSGDSYVDCLTVR